MKIRHPDSGVTERKPHGPASDLGSAAELRDGTPRRRIRKEVAYLQAVAFE